MHPIFFELWGHSLHSYIAMLNLAFFVGMGLWLIEGKRVAIEPSLIVRWTIVSFVVGLVGARSLHLLVRFAQGDLPAIGARDLSQGGIVYLGGFIMAFGVMIFLAQRARKNVRTVLNSGAAPLAAAHAIGRVGCLLNGCCFGSVCSFPWAVTYSNPYSIAPQGLPLHPSQAYEAMALFALSGFLWINSRRALLPFDNIRIYLFGYGVFRFLIEFTRGDLLRGLFLGLSTSQWLSILLIGIALSLDFPKGADHNPRNENRS